MLVDVYKGLKDRRDIAGFVSVKEFDGQVTRISLTEAKKLLELLVLLEDSGYVSVAIGVENNKPILFFIDKDNTLAYAVANYGGDE